VHLCTLYWWLRFDFLLFSLVCGKVHGTAFASLCTNGLSETAEDHETRGYKTKNCDQDGFPTMFSGVRIMSSNVFVCLEDASLLFSCKCRPFGSAAILGGYDRDGPQLYMIEPSGVAYVCSHLQPSMMMLMLSLLFLVLDMGKCGLRSLSFFWSFFFFMAVAHCL
jgi:hypothetical protein